METKTLAKLTLLISFLIFSLNAFSQTDEAPKVGEAWRLMDAYDFIETDRSGAANGASQSVPSGSNFTIEFIDNDNYTVRFWNWNDDNYLFDGETNRSKRGRLNLNGHQIRYFKLERPRFAGRTKRIYKPLTPVLGVVSYPFKYYPQDKGRFEKAFSISVTGGYKILLDRTEPDNAVALTLGVGVSTLTLNSDNSSIAVEDKDQEAGTASLSFNAVYIHDRLQIGISMGVDKIINGNPNGWNRDGNLWLGFGVGVNIFTIDKPTPETNGGN